MRVEVEEELGGEGERRRKSKNSKINKKRRMLLLIEERVWMVLNRGVKGNEEWEFVYQGERWYGDIFGVRG